MSTIKKLRMSPEAIKSTREEARSYKKKGDDSLKTSLFQWKPDYLAASMYYENAAKNFKKINEFNDAIEMFEKCALNSNLAGIYSTAALAMTEVAVFQSESNPKKAVESYIKASDYWMKEGSMNKYSEAYFNAAKLVCYEFNLLFIVYYYYYFINIYLLGNNI